MVPRSENKTDTDSQKKISWQARLKSIILISTWIPFCWFAFQFVHETGHAIGAWATGGTITQFVVDPFTISRTDVSPNPYPYLVVWAGPLLGVVIPLAIWLVVRAIEPGWAFLPRFFAGFCLVANGAYIGVGSFGKIGDAGVMLATGSPAVLLWTFGLLGVLLGLLLWNGLSVPFGISRSEKSEVEFWAPLASASLLATLLLIMFLLSD